MDHTVFNSSALQEFLLDAQVLLTQSQECLQHLELIANDPDACHCLNNTLGTLARRANGLGLFEVAHYAAALQQLTAPACRSLHLRAVALPPLHACLTLLAWQLELVDPRTGRLALDTTEQMALLHDLATALDQPLPQTCAPCRDSASDCLHPHPHAEPAMLPASPFRAH
ncbi:histidine kinase [Pseudomonas sp. PSKL.D1]|uniref:histidine kinase n=1 Tax=Pseudomonas sp. PSKL.D1 TaxID=3029060 RepID=UPI0023815210|nr:histidine kinase [Pseudomonas sp. PSKL.D1]WDY56424.1 histidine kinase [Pseudomonas sp. PSKL.D1]